MQACRGGKFDYGVESEAIDSPAPVDIDDKKVVQYNRCIEYCEDVSCSFSWMQQRRWYWMKMRQMVVPTPKRPYQLRQTLS